MGDDSKLQSEEENDLYHTVYTIILWRVLKYLKNINNNNKQ